MKERAINPYALWLSSIRGVGAVKYKRSGESDDKDSFGDRELRGRGLPYVRG